MERLTIEDMKSIELEIMDEIDRVCVAHGVQYYLGYGSLLGAVRHGGFIPWDDDMDIVMMRDQYELLIMNGAQRIASSLCRIETNRPFTSLRRSWIPLRLFTRTS